MYNKPNYVSEIIADNGEVVLFSHISGKIARISESCSVQYKNYMTDGRYNLSNQYLIDNFFLSDEEKYDERALITRIRKEVVNQAVLHLTIMPTEQCNFRCVYCYETYEKGKMTLSIAQAIVKYIEKEIHKFKGLVISWFGGEPLLAMDIVEYISEKAIEICKKERKYYVADMTTNGYLLSLDVVKRLYQLRVFKYQITLDGVAKIHDTQRVLCDGGATYQSIVTNILDIKEKFRKKFLEITIRTNVTMDVINEGLDEFLDFLQKNFANDNMFDFRFRIAWKPQGKTIDEKLYVISKEEAYRQLYNKLRKIEGLNYKGDLEGMLVGGWVCYSARKNSYIIGSDGSIYKCTARFDDDMNQIGVIGTDGEMDIDKKKLAFWNKDVVSFERCESCALEVSCLSIGCPYAVSDEKECRDLKIFNDYIVLLSSKEGKNTEIIYTL